MQIIMEHIPISLSFHNSSVHVYFFWEYIEKHVKSADYLVSEHFFSDFL